MAQKRVIEMEADMAVKEAILMRQLKVAYSGEQIEGAKRDYASEMGACEGEPVNEEHVPQ
jgi:cbb3-type cytochrome oxidase cytochrome c subunit